jgi:septum site-determining protein MinD
VPRMLLVVNKTPAVFDSAEVRLRVETAYGCPVAAVFPHSDDLMVLSSAEVFVAEFPDHEVSELFARVADQLVS